MKTVILAAFAALSLSMGFVSAQATGSASPQQNGGDYNITAGAAGWG